MLDRIRAALLVTALLLPGCSGMAAAQSGGASLLQGPLPSFAPLVKRVVPAVVNIAVTEVSGPAIAQPRPYRLTSPTKNIRLRATNCKACSARPARKPAGRRAGTGQRPGRFDPD